MLTAFIVCCLIGLALTVYDNLRKPQALIRGLQEGNYGGLVFYFVATPLLFAVPLFLLYLAGYGLYSLFS